MLRLAEVRRSIETIVAVACLAGCSAGPLAAPPGSASQAVLAAFRPDAQFYGNDFVYTTHPDGNDVTVYARKGLSLTFLDTLSLDVAAPQGIVATPSSWFYLANSGDSNILIYRSTRQGPKGPRATLDDSGEVPVNVSVTPDRGLIAVSNGTSAGSGTGSVSVYVSGSKPSRILTYGSDLLQGEGVAIDPQGNCYWSFNDLSNPSTLGSIVEFESCNGNGTLIVSGITSPGGMAFDQSGDLYYVDEASGIYKCRQISNCALFATGFGLPTNINFDAKAKDLWVADATGYIDAVNPETGAIENQIVSVGGAPYGIAPSPGN